MNGPTRTEVIAQLQAHQADLTRLGVRSLGIFGSVARDEAQANSDVDVLVEFEGEITFDRYMDLQEFLEGLLARKVDLVTPTAIRAPLKPEIEREVVYVTSGRFKSTTRRRSASFTGKETEPAREAGIIKARSDS